jgi:hypothetical protein
MDRRLSSSASSTANATGPDSRGVRVVRSGCFEERSRVSCGSRLRSSYAGFADTLRRGGEAGRESLVPSQGAWTARRAVRFDDYICIRTYHDGDHALPDVKLLSLQLEGAFGLMRRRPTLVAAFWEQAELFPL